MNTRLRLAAAPAILATAAVVLLAGCQGSSSGSGGDQPSAAPSAQAGGPGNGSEGAAGDGPGLAPGGGAVTGEIAAVTGTVAQVRGTDGQTSVTWTGSTTFERTTTGTLADVKVGACVTAVAVGQGADASSSSSGAVTRVTITPAGSDGTCTGGFGGGRGGFPGGRDGQRPSGAPTDLPGGGQRGANGERPTGGPGAGRFPGGFGGFTSGKVTAVSGSTITVDALQLGTGGSTPTTAPKQVAVDASTTYTTTARSDASAVKVGLCAVARGKADDSGAVTATSITLSDKVDGSCSTGFGGRGFGRPGQGTGEGSTNA
ncbi:hypothetical protein [Cellulomonas alba]|uniref:DUF5666 domain-containing protein n=1 Tax=Cellulomonas alba TaxID=3053467 RepID=A0ABT7SE49_9CELL|nr:hypothetical protein [Cellulomonas alba]MDM7854445.1 hypothetical protein [Cellulomonas alba]